MTTNGSNAGNVNQPKTQPKGGSGRPNTKKKGRSKPDWAAQIADRVVRRAERDGFEPTADHPLVCASGISPSGPIHLGNMRELMVPHFVVEELRSRGIPSQHILSWDDYDRLRKVPAGISDDFAIHVGKPLTAVPDPHGELESWAERFKSELRPTLAQLGMDIREISQTEMYGAGRYQKQIIEAIEQRKLIDSILGRYRTLEEGETTEEAGDGVQVLTTDGLDETDDSAAGDYWPYRVYCHSCDRDTTTMTSVEPGDESYWVNYSCDCGHSGRFDLMLENRGKLVWKVDWPMRWAYESVIFEAAGADHSSPGSSFTVGSDLVTQVYNGRAPEYMAYSFVGTRGTGKMSSSSGAVPTPADALKVLEAPILRWMYVRKSPRQGITIDMGSGIHALYDEWDQIQRKIAGGSVGGSQLQAVERARQTSVRASFDTAKTVVPFRTLASASAVAAGDRTQMARIVAALTDVAADDIASAEPRLTKADYWMKHVAPREERIEVRTTPDVELLQNLTAQQTTWLELLVAGLDDEWSLDGLRTLVYGVPKAEAGLTADAPPTDELKAHQREFFKLLYRLLLSVETGPRVPTLLMAIGRERLLKLLTV